MDSLRDIELPTFEFDFDNNVQDSDEELLNACLELEQYEQYLSNEDPMSRKKQDLLRLGAKSLTNCYKMLKQPEQKKTRSGLLWFLKEKISIFQQILGALFPFRAEYGFPVVVHGIQDGRTEGRTDGRKETCVRAGTLCRSMENRLDGWSEAKGIQVNIEDMSFEELDINLRKFYAEARSQNGDHYSRATLLSLRNGIERYLNSPPHNIPIKIGKDPRFVLSNKVLDAQIKQLKRDGKENTAHKPPLADEDLRKLKTSQVLSPSNPHSLLKNVWFHVSLYWCRRGREGQQKLSSRSFTFEKDANQRENTRKCVFTYLFTPTKD
ncbi:hypothetical protein AC249_AIPGENE2908 [Exaiptasia diaphana]|nr:hypothetical protein AC249_AIPGENE2908 [Exaiptasia diaphana]